MRHPGCRRSRRARRVRLYSRQTSCGVRMREPVGEFGDALHQIGFSDVLLNFANDRASYNSSVRLPPHGANVLRPGYTESDCDWRSGMRTKSAQESFQIAIELLALAGD